MTESEAFADARLVVLLGEYVDFDRDRLVRRLEAASSRLGELGAKVADESGGGDAQGWSAKEVLAHIAGFSRLFGVVGYRIGSGKLTRMELTEQVAGRDASIEQMRGQPAADLVEFARGEHERTLVWLRRAAPAELLRRCDVGGGATMSAEEVIRLALCAHLEKHLDQLEVALKEA